MILKFHGELADAEERCKQALKIDKKYWRASLLRAKLTKSPKNAIEILEKLTKRFEEKNLHEEHKEAFADIAYTLGSLYWDENKINHAVDSYLESIRRDPSAERAFEIISNYKEKGKWFEIAELIHDINEVHLTGIVIAMSQTEDFHTIILQALKETKMLGSEELALIYEDAIHITKDRDHARSFFLRHYYAGALAALNLVPTEKVRDVLEDAVRDLPYTNFDLPSHFFLVGYRLGAIYLGEAQKAKDDKRNEAVQKALKKLEDILPEQLNEDQMRLPLSLFCARYYLKIKDPESARDKVHNTLKMAVELLSDNDASNDILAYWKILFATIPFGDERNATAALAMMKKGGDFEMKCSCGCGHIWDTPGEMWWCKDCINVVLTKNCKEALRDPAVRTQVCHMSHCHFEIPPWNEKKMDVPEVPYKGIAITMEDWKKKIIKKYHLSKPGALHVLQHPESIVSPIADLRLDHRVDPRRWTESFNKPRHALSATLVTSDS